MEYVVPILGAITALLAGIAGYRRVVDAGKDSAAKRWQELADRLEARVADLEFDRSANEEEIDAQQKRIRELEQKERASNERLLSLERDHGQLAREHKALKAEHTTLRSKFTRLEKRVEYYRRGVALLIEQILEHGLEPAWRPDEADESRKEK